MSSFKTIDLDVNIKLWERGKQESEMIEWEDDSKYQRM